jgi:MATE family multidrug resistance protein
MFRSVHASEKEPGEARVLLRLAWPVVISQVSHTLVGLADTLMVGNTGNVTALAASALANNVFSVAIVFCIGISCILSPRVSEALAAGNRQECSELLKASFANNMLWSLLIAGILWFLIPLAPMLGQPPLVLEQALPFFELLIWGLPGLMLFQTFRQFMDGLGDTRPGMIVSIAGNLLNVFLNYLLIYGKGGFPELGLYGAGISNLISRSLMGAGMAAMFYYSKGSKEWIPQFLRARATLSRFRELNRQGFPVALQYLFEVGAFSCTALMVGQMGEGAISAHQIVITLASVTYMMASGLSAAASIRAGHFYGLGDMNMLRKSGWISFQLAAVFMALTALVFLLLRNEIPLLFIRDAEVAETASSLLIIAGFFQLSDGIQVVGLGCLRGISDVVVPALITVVAYWVIAIPLGYWLGIPCGMGPAGPWWGLLAGLSFSALFLFIRFFIYSGKLRSVKL